MILRKETVSAKAGEKLLIPINMRDGSLICIGKGNEGLSSRITFHLDFPDYKPKELCQILEFMTKRRGYKLGEGSYEKCLEVCDKACRSKDYGNGRFARNLLEQAEMAQAHRIMGEKKVRAIKKEDLMILTPPVLLSSHIPEA